MKTAHARRLLTVPASGLALALCLGLAACGHKPAPAPPAPPPPPAAQPAPTLTLNASPTAIESGAQSKLTWSSTNAVRVELNGSPVNLNGSQTVSPTDSTDYNATATSADGQTANATVRVTVTQPAPPPPPPAPATNEIGFSDAVKDAFFDFDKSDIRPDAIPVLQSDADYLKAHPGTQITIVGHCDDRGSAEYNLALGNRRAEAVKNYLVSLGVDSSNINTVSVGKEQPFCTQDSEDCWQMNRRGHFEQGNGGN